MNGLTSSKDVIIRVDRWEEAIGFYEKTLGFPIISRHPGMVGFDTGSFHLYVERGVPHGPVFDFLARDFEPAKAALIAAGCELIEEDPSVPRCYLRDPNGLCFNLGLPSV
jgi:catechol 2,3-dioxygenase-like lactoylglutathione lyase family enzyme